MTTVFVDIRKVKEVDLENFYKEYGVYDTKGNFINMLQNTPLVINIRGQHFFLEDIYNNERDWIKKRFIRVFIECCKRGEKCEKKIPNIKWRIL
jgi:hypothetical protein